MLGNLIGAGASLLGGLFGQQSQAKTAEKNIALQREFAESGIQMKVADAKKAGVHPLAALGASTTSFSPVSVGTPLATGIAAAGQDISRAVNATQNTDQRAFVMAQAALTTENMELQNQLLRSQITRMNQTSAPPMPVEQRYLLEGQGQTATPRLSRNPLPGVLVTDKPLDRTAADPNALHSEAGAVTDMGFARTATGYAPVPSRNTQERIEDNIISQITWAIRNQMLPSLGYRHIPPNIGDDNQDWYYDVGSQEYRQRPPYRGPHQFRPHEYYRYQR